MPRPTIRLQLALVLAAGASAHALTPDCSGIGVRFASVDLAAADPASQQSCADAAAHYEELRAGLVTARPVDLVDRIRVLGRELAMPDSDVDALVPRYQQLQNSLLLARASWKDGRYVRPDGRPFSEEQLRGLAPREAQDAGESARAFTQHNTELLAIQELARKGDSGEAAARLGRLVEGLGQRRELLEHGFGTAPMETTLALVQQTRRMLPKAQQAQVDAKIPTIDRQLRAIAAKKIEVPGVTMGRSKEEAKPVAGERSMAELAFYNALSELPLVSGWARERSWEAATAGLLKGDKSVTGFAFSRKDPWGHGREGVEIVYKDGTQRYESMDSPPAMRIVSADGKKIIETDPRRAYFSQSEDGKVTVRWERDAKTGRVVGRFRGMVFDADVKDTIFVSPDGDKLFIARGKDKDGRPKVREWLGASRRERGRMVAGLGQVVSHFGEGVFHEDAVLDPTLTRRVAAGEKIDLAPLGLKRVSPESLKRLESYLADLPQFGGLFEMSFKGASQTQNGVEMARWVESLYIRDGQLHVVLGSKDGPAGSKPGYNQLVAVVDDEAGQKVLKSFYFSGKTTFMWKFSPDMSRCDQFMPDAEAHSEGSVAFKLNRRMAKTGGKWKVTENFPLQVKEWTAWDTLKTLGSSTLGVVGDGVGVVFSPFQTALYGIEGGIWMAGGAIGSAVDKESGTAAFAKVAGVYTLRQAKFNEWLGNGTKGEAQIMDSYAQANSVINESTRKDLKAFLDGEVDKGRRKQYGELYRFHKDDPVSERDRAHAAARTFGLGNMAGQYFEQGRESWEGGSKVTGALQYGAGIFVVGGEAFVEGAGFGLAAQPLKMAAVGSRTGQTVEQVSGAMRKAQQGVQLTQAEARSVGMLKTIGRMEMATFLTPAGVGFASDVAGLVRSVSDKDKEGVWAHAEGLARNVGAFGVAFGLSAGQGLAQKHIEDFLAVSRPRPVEPVRVEVEMSAPKDPQAALLAKLDIEAPAKAQAMREALETDAMTGVPNRASIVRAASDRIEKTIDAKGEPVVSILDMNNFGAVNEGLASVHGPTGGTARADGILVKAAGRLDGLARQFGVEFGRFGGEEFVVVGDKAAVLKFIEASRTEFADGQVLRDAGVTADEMAAIQRAAEAKGRGDQSIGDFTMGAAPAKSSLGFSDALHQADNALNYAKQNGGRGKGFMAEGSPDAPVFTEASPALSSVERFAVKAQKLARGKIVSEDLPTIAERMEALRATLGTAEFAEFTKTAFQDGLTGARTKEFVEASAPVWKQQLPDGAPAALISARGLKTINDALGHEAGDAYLRTLGRVISEVVAEQRAAGKMLEDPVRYASKDFLFVGEGAPQAAAEASARMEAVMRGDSVLRPDMRARLESWLRQRGETLPDDLGTLRSTTVEASEPGLAAKARASANPLSPAIDLLVRRLDGAKQAEQAAPTVNPAAPAPVVETPAKAPASANLDAVGWMERAGKQGLPGAGPAPFRALLTTTLRGFQKDAPANPVLESGHASYQKGDVAAIEALQKQFKSGLMERGAEVLKAEGIDPKSVVTHGTSLKGFMGMLMSGGIEATTRHGGFSGEGANVWGGYGLDVGAGYAFMRAINTKQPGVFLILHNAAQPLKIVHGDTISRVPSVESDFAAAVISDGGRTVVLGREELQALRTSALSWQKQVVAEPMSPQFREWERVKDYLAP